MATEDHTLWYYAIGPNDKILASVGIPVDDPDALRDNPFPETMPVQNIVLSEQSREDYELGRV